MIENQFVDLIIEKYFQKENVFVSNQIDSYNDLLIHSPVQKENQHKKDQEQIRLKSLKTLENIEETYCESKYLKIF